MCTSPRPGRWSNMPRAALHHSVLLQRAATLAWLEERLRVIDED